MTIVKICGMRTVAHAIAAIVAGADMIGFIFAPARRQVSIAEAREIIAAVRSHPAGGQVQCVGVFVNATAAEMRETAHSCSLDMLQLSGDEHPEIVGQLGALPLLKTVRLHDDPNETAWLDAASNDRMRLHVDAHVAGSYGGAGVIADWPRAAALGRQHAILLSGGLTPENVGDAIAVVRPWGVDVSSGVETDGVKDTDKITAFIQAVRATNQALALPV